MSTDKELFDQMKESYAMNPRPDFVSNTELYLRKAAKKAKRKSSFQLISITSGGLIACIIALSWLFTFSGKEFIHHTLTSLKENTPSAIMNKNEPLIYIYHTHNHESFSSETLSKDPNKAFHHEKNISLVGSRFSQALDKRNISNIHEKGDVMGDLKQKGETYYQSYTVSRELLNNALENNESIKMAFDIHRDSHKRNATTTKINGKDYAKIVFIVSQSSQNYDENLNFAENLHNKIMELYPGLSRGIVIKSDTNKQSTYNQDLKDELVILEIGGFENTLEEEYRTVDALAEVIEEILKTGK